MAVCWFWQDACAIEYATWTQAIGSIVAIGIAPWLARSAERQRISDNNKLMQIFTFEVISNLQLMVHLIETRNRVSWGQAISRLRHAIDASQRIDPSLLPYAAAVSITDLRQIAEQAVSGGEFLQDDDIAQLKKLVDGWYSSASETGKTVMKAIGERKWWQRGRS